MIPLRQAACSLVIYLVGCVDYDSAPTGYYYEPRYLYKLGYKKVCFSIRIIET